MNLKAWHHRADHVRPNTGSLGSPYDEQIAEMQRGIAARIQEAQRVGDMAQAIVESYGGAAEPKTVHYRIRGLISPASRKGEFYDVDLTVEARND